jgi:acyl carrier protein phosphodiesterase
VSRKNPKRARWNSWYDAAERAVLLRPVIDEFVDHELADYHVKLAQWSGSRSQATRLRPVEPQIAYDQLTSNDWSIVASYLSLLKPCKQATIRLQGNVSTTTRRGLAVKRAIWQVLPIFDEISRVFEEARRMHPTAHSQRSQLNGASLTKQLQLRH